MCSRMFSGISLLFKNVMIHQGHLFALHKHGSAVGVRIKQANMPDTMVYVQDCKHEKLLEKIQITELYRAEICLHHRSC